MSGHKVVSFLDFHKEAYIHGGPVRRRKQTAVGRFASKNKHSTAVDLTEYVIGNSSTFKLRSRVNATDSKKKSNVDKKIEAADDSEGDQFDADAMMIAAAQGENIASVIAAADARKQKRAKQSQAKHAANPPTLVWKQSHCYIKGVTPLMTVDGELDLEKQKREEDRREREELMRAMEIARKGMEAPLGMLGLTNAVVTPDKPTDDANAKKNADGENEFGEIVGGVAAHIDPNDTRIKESHVHGFVMHYFTTDKKGKLAAEMTPTAKGLLDKAAGSLPTPAGCQDLDKKVTAVNKDIFPTLRHRLFMCHSLYDQDEWCLVYRSVLLNYWHERLESSVIRDADIFQFQQFAMGRSSKGSAYGVVQCVLSTGALFIIPRGSKAEFEHDNAVTAKKMPIGALKKVVSERAKNAVTISGGTELDGYSLSFFSGAESCEFVVELQRVWEMGAPGAASGAFPYITV